VPPDPILYLAAQERKYFLSAEYAGIYDKALARVVQGFNNINLAVVSD